MRSPSELYIDQLELLVRSTVLDRSRSSSSSSCRVVPTYKTVRYTIVPFQLPRARKLACFLIRVYVVCDVFEVSLELA